jgi:quercetin dioxygenase-like cupin family protein
MTKRVLCVLLCALTFLIGCTHRQANPNALEIQEDTTLTVELKNILRRAHQHQVIFEDWGSLSWLASKPLGNAEGLTVGRATIKAGQTNPRHRHPKSEEVLYLLKGKISHTLDDKTVVMSAGDVITIAPGVFHNASCIGSEDADMIVVYSQGTRGFELE